jgi:hypothetical protein
MTTVTEAVLEPAAQEFADVTASYDRGQIFETRESA